MFVLTSVKEPAAETANQPTVRRNVKTAQGKSSFPALHLASEWVFQHTFRQSGHFWCGSISSDSNLWQVDFIINLNILPKDLSSLSTVTQFQLPGFHDCANWMTQMQRFSAMIYIWERICGFRLPGSGKHHTMFSRSIHWPKIFVILFSSTDE